MARNDASVRTSVPTRTNAEAAEIIASLRSGRPRPSGASIDRKLSRGFSDLPLLVLGYGLPMSAVNRFVAKIDSAETPNPRVTRKPERDAPIARPGALASRTSDQGLAPSGPSGRIRREADRKASNAYRLRSEIHGSGVRGVVRGRMRRISSPRSILDVTFLVAVCPRVWTERSLPIASNGSTASLRCSSHGRACLAYGLEVRAPTGHRSTRCPESSVRRRVGR